VLFLAQPPFECPDSFRVGGFLFRLFVLHFAQLRTGIC
jgi:hypothetical protein